MKRELFKIKIYSLSYLMTFLNQNQCPQPRLVLVDKIKREMSLYKTEHVADLDSIPLNERKHTFPLIVN